MDFFLPLLLREEECEYFRKRRYEKELLREMQDPFSLSDYEFQMLFRVPPDLAQDLINEATPFLQRQRSSGLSVESQVWHCH